MKVRLLLPAVLWLALQTLSAAAGSGAMPDEIKPIQPLGQKSPEQREYERKKSNKDDLAAILLVDSVGWGKTLAVQGKVRPLEDLRRERAERRRSWLDGYCRTERWAKLAEVDSLKKLSPEEREVCKDKLRLENPLIP